MRSIYGEILKLAESDGPAQAVRVMEQTVASLEWIIECGSEDERTAAGLLLSNSYRILKVVMKHPKLSSKPKKK